MSAFASGIEADVLPDNYGWRERVILLAFFLSLPSSPFRETSGTRPRSTRIRHCSKVTVLDVNSTIPNTKVALRQPTTSTSSRNLCRSNTGNVHRLRLILYSSSTMLEWK
jgi:hypothetical protein